MKSIINQIGEVNLPSGWTFNLGGGSAAYGANRVAAAVQAAVWEIVDEFNTDTTGPGGDTVVPTGWNVKSDLFRVSGDVTVQNLANAMFELPGFEC